MNGTRDPVNRELQSRNLNENVKPGSGENTSYGSVKKIVCVQCDSGIRIPQNLAHVFLRLSTEAKLDILPKTCYNTAYSNM